jgi:ketopantoate hydroxymethyltransferase
LLGNGIALGTQYNTINSKKNVLAISIHKIIHLGRAIHYAKMHCIVLDKKYNVYSIHKMEYMNNTNTCIVFFSFVATICFLNGLV